MTVRDTRALWLFGSFAAVIVLLFFNAALLINDLRTLHDAQQRTIASYNAINHLNGVLLGIKNAEAAQLGYLLTGRERYLFPYSMALNDIAYHRQQLDAIYNSPYGALMNHIRVHLDILLIEFEKATVMRREGRAEEALAIVNTDTGLDAMSALREVITGFLALEQKARIAAEAEAGKIQGRLAWTFLLTTGLALIALVLLYVFISRDIRQRQRIAQHLRLHRDELDNRVQLRTRELEAANAELVRSAAALEQTNRELEELTFIASHDLQEPLRKIHIFAGLIAQQESARISADSHDLLARLQMASERMSDLINDLLLFSRVRDRQAAFIPVMLDDILASVQDDLAGSIEETGATLTSDSLPVVEADPAQMRQLLFNLVGNALKFRRPDVAPHITIRYERQQEPTGAWHQICVTDNGIGFDSKHATRIFKPFQRLHGRHEYPGTGIGLTICLRIAERHGGLLTATGEPGEGATFCLWLPTSPAAVPLAETEAALETAPPDAYQQ